MGDSGGASVRAAPSTELSDFTLHGEPLIVRWTFIDVAAPAGSGEGGRRRARSEPPGEAPAHVVTLGDMRRRCFSADGPKAGPRAAASGASAGGCGGREPLRGPGERPAPPAGEPGRGASPGSGSGAPPGSDSEPEGPWTTMMLRNLPESLSRAMLLELLDRNGFSRRYDFIYLPIDFGSRCSFGYAFVNLVDAEEAGRFMEHFQGFCDWPVPSDKVAAVNWSGKRQGLQGQIDRYRNSPMMHADMPDEAKPIVLRDGQRVEFPPPTQTVKSLRVRPSKARKARHLGLDVISSECTRAK